MLLSAVVELREWARCKPRDNMLPLFDRATGSRLMLQASLVDRTLFWRGPTSMPAKRCLWGMGGLALRCGRPTDLRRS